MLTLTLLPETLVTTREDADYVDPDGDLHAEFSVTGVYAYGVEDGEDDSARAIYREAKEVLRPFLAEAIRSACPAAKVDGYCENIDADANIEPIGSDRFRITVYASGIIFA